MSQIGTPSFIHRRKFLQSSVAGLAMGLSPVPIRSAVTSSKIQAVAFDAFPILNPAPVFALVVELFPEKGAELGNLWRTRQFEYTWLRTLEGHYADFWRVTEDALVFAAKFLKLELTSEKRDRLMNAYLQLKAHPDVAESLATLRRAGIRLGFLSNFTARMLEAGIRNSGLDGAFDQILSTDRVRAFKPDPRAYQMGIDAFHLKREEILFAPFAAWDMAGARRFGYPTFWVNRGNVLPEELGAIPDGSGSSLTDLVKYLEAGASRQSR